MAKVLCKVGGWTIMATPGQKFTFGQGGTAWGPIPLDKVEEGMDVEGLAEAKPISSYKLEFNGMGRGAWATPREVWLPAQDAEKAKEIIREAFEALWEGDVGGVDFPDMPSFLARKDEDPSQYAERCWEIASWAWNGPLAFKVIVTRIEA